MRRYIVVFIFLSFYTMNAQVIDYIKISQKFLESAKFQDDSTSYYLKVLADADEKTLQKQFINDDAKKAFFINLYNAFTNDALKKDPNKYKNRGQFFRSKQFNLAGNKISLDIIEHGFLRKSSIKLSLGKLQKIFPSRLEKIYRVEKVDYRIHFSLNCGAKSCPMIAFYEPQSIDKQLDVATASYLNGDASYDEATNTLSLPALMSWFRGDFGNKKGILKICKDLKIIPENVKPKLKYNKYDWTLYLENFKY